MNRAIHIVPLVRRIFSSYLPLTHGVHPPLTHHRNHPMPSHGMAISPSILVRFTNPRNWRAPPLNDESFRWVVWRIRPSCGDGAGVLVAVAIFWYVFGWGVTWLATFLVFGQDPLHVVLCCHMFQMHSWLLLKFFGVLWVVLEELLPSKATWALPAVRPF